MHSATIMALQIPFKPKSIGRIMTDALSKTRVRRNAITAEVNPSPSAVKKAEPKIEKPQNKNEMA